jgi:hypothetical protein
VLELGTDTVGLAASLGLRLRLWLLLSGYETRDAGGGSWETRSRCFTAALSEEPTDYSRF